MAKEKSRVGVAVLPVKDMMFLGKDDTRKHIV